MNWNKLKEVAEAIREERKREVNQIARFDMEDWLKTRYNYEGEITPCGTTACVAGYLALMHDRKRALKTEGNGDRIKQMAYEALGVTDPDVQDDMTFTLFHGGPFKLHKLSEHPSTPDMLTWMAENQSYSWHDAAEALDIPIDELMNDDELQYGSSL